MQILYNQQKQKGEQKIKTTRAEATAKKVNNMPNLQSMSQAKGYGRLSKKSSQNSPVSVKSPVNPTSPSLISTLLGSDTVENPCWIPAGFEYSIVRTLGSSDNRFLSFFLNMWRNPGRYVTHVLVLNYLLHNNDFSSLIPVGHYFRVLVKIKSMHFRFDLKSVAIRYSS